MRDLEGEACHPGLFPGHVLFTVITLHRVVPVALRVDDFLFYSTRLYNTMGMVFLFSAAVLSFVLGLLCGCPRLSFSCALLVMLLRYRHHNVPQLLFTDVLCVAIIVLDQVKFLALILHHQLENPRFYDALYALLRPRALHTCFHLRA